MALGKKLGKINKSFVSKNDRFKTVSIPDIPIMLGEDNSIICIPKEDSAEG